MIQDDVMSYIEVPKSEIGLVEETYRDKQEVDEVSWEKENYFNSFVDWVNFLEKEIEKCGWSDSERDWTIEEDKEEEHKEPEGLGLQRSP